MIVQKRSRNLGRQINWIFVLLISLTACSAAPPQPPEISSPAPVLLVPAAGSKQALSSQPADVERAIIAQVNPVRVFSDLRRLSGEDPICFGADCRNIVNRFTGSEDLQRVKTYISNELTGLGYSVQFQDWSNGKYGDQNLIVRKPGVDLPGEVIYLIAHMDGVKGDEGPRYPAANDDGSGVADLLELSRVISGLSFRRSVVLLFSTGEEQGTLGVKSLLERLSPEEQSSIKYVINIDMIGYDPNGDRVMQLLHGDQPASEQFARSLSDVITGDQIAVVPRLAPGCG